MAPFMDYKAKQSINGMPNYTQGYDNNYLLDMANWGTPTQTSGLSATLGGNIPTTSNIPTPVDATTTKPGFFSWDRALGNDKQMGWTQAGLGIASALGQGFLGWNQYNLEKDKLALSKDAFNKNYGAQVKEYNMNVADRGNARASATGDFAGAKEYYAANKLS